MSSLRTFHSTRPLPPRSWKAAVIINLRAIPTSFDQPIGTVRGGWGGFVHEKGLLQRRIGTSGWAVRARRRRKRSFSPMRNSRPTACGERRSRPWRLLRVVTGAERRNSSRWAGNKTSGSTCYQSQRTDRPLETRIADGHPSGRLVTTASTVCPIPTIPAAAGNAREASPAPSMPFPPGCHAGGTEKARPSGNSKTLEDPSEILLAGNTSGSLAQNVTSGGPIGLEDEEASPGSTETTTAAASPHPADPPGAEGGGAPYGRRDADPPLARRPR